MQEPFTYVNVVTSAAHKREASYLTAVGASLCSPRRARLRSRPTPWYLVDMARRAASVASPPAVKNALAPGPPLPVGWKTTFLDHVREHGHYARAARAAGIDQTTARRHRQADPAFEAACLDAREEAADLIEEKMIASADRSDNPAGFIVRLKALRPAEYIEKNLTVSVNLTAEVPMDEMLPVLRAMLADASAPTKAMLGLAEPGA